MLLPLTQRPRPAARLLLECLQALQQLSQAALLAASTRTLLCPSLLAPLAPHQPFCLEVFPVGHTPLCLACRLLARLEAHQPVPLEVPLAACP